MLSTTLTATGVDLAAGVRINFTGVAFAALGAPADGQVVQFRLDETGQHRLVERGVGLQLKGET